MLKELQDYSVEEIAEILNLKPTTVKVRLHRARKRMLEDLRRWREENKGHAL
jgi:DNA-directed RNA polymerase specialized sigma24 family protein